MYEVSIVRIPFLFRSYGTIERNVDVSNTFIRARCTIIDNDDDNAAVAASKTFIRIMYLLQLIIK